MDQEKNLTPRKKLGKGLNVGAKRHRKILRDNVYGLSKPSLRRLAYVAGVKRLQNQTYDDVRDKAKNFLNNILKDAITVMEHDRRSTLQTKDVLYSLDRHGIKYYGAEK